MNETYRIMNNGRMIPKIGYGTFMLEKGTETESAVRTAIDLGYRLIDTAKMYGNEESVGKAVRESGVSREELFVTTKLHPEDQGFDSALNALDRSLSRMKLDYIDMYMIHWPGEHRYIETWKAFEKLSTSGKVKSIGVCNFQKHHLEELERNSGILPVVNQVERHPFFTQKPLHDYLMDHGVILEAWGPLMRGDNLMKHTLFAEIGEKYGKTPAQIILRWHIDTDSIPVPKSSSPKRMAENIDIFDYNLSKEEIQAINHLNENMRLGRDPDSFLF